MTNRRQLLATSAATLAVLTATPQAFAATYDILIKNGRVIDPSTSRPSAHAQAWAQSLHLTRIHEGLFDSSPHDQHALAVRRRWLVRRHGDLEGGHYLGCGAGGIN